MTAQEQKDLRTYCAFLLKEYGIFISPDNPVIPALYIFYKHTQTVHQSNQVLVSQVQEALIKLNPKQFHFHHPGEAWKFQIAAGFKWIVVGLFISVLMMLGTWHWSRVNDGEAAKAILQSSGNMRILFHRVKMNEQGDLFIDFTAPVGDSIRHFIDYQRLDKKTIRIYLGKDSTFHKN